jgi:hypothetical protein
MSAAGLAGTARAQVTITDVEIGFPSAEPGDEVGAYYKAGTWVPLRIQVRAGEQPFPGGTLWVETWDSDDVLNRYPAAIGPLRPGQVGTVPAFACPGSLGADIRVIVGSRTITSTAKQKAEALDYSRLLYLKLGSPSRDLQQAIRVLEPDPRQLRIRHTVYVDQAGKLPVRWFGYAGVDLVILTTADPALLDALLRPEHRDQVQALGDWICRGGRLIVSVSPPRAARVAELLRRLQVPLTGVLTGRDIGREQLQGLTNYAETHDKPFRVGNASISQFRLRQPGVGPVEELAREGEDLPLIVRGPHGLGSVTLLAIDLDEKPFTDWAGRGEFWQKMITRLGPRAGMASPDSGGGSDKNDVATDLQRELEVFPDVRPVSFGLVALLIFVYIMVVGPLDYFFLRSVVRRFRWTWVTFPIVIVGATLAARLPSGSGRSPDLRVNKVDLVEIDLLGHAPRTQVTSWFALYSPTMERLSVDVEPAPSWVMAPPRGELPRAVVSWLGRPEDGGLNSTGRPRSEPLYRARYQFRPDAAGLAGVPISFASTKSFTATWQADCPDLVTARLRYDPSSPGRIAGTVTNHLMVELDQPILYYGGKWRSFVGGRLSPAKPALLSLEAPREFDDWMVIGPGTEPPVPGKFEPTRLVKSALFHEESTRGSNRRNNLLRTLDQSWRLPDVNVPEGVPRQAILFARLPRQTGPLADLLKSNLLPSRLRLGAVRPEGPDQPVAASLTQDTYLRVYIPVTAPPKGDR